MAHQLNQYPNHLSYINDKTIQIFNLYLLPAHFIEDLKKVGYMPIHDDKHNVDLIVR